MNRKFFYIILSISVFLITSYYMLSLLYPSRSELCEEYFTNATSEKLSAGRRMYEYFGKTLSIKNPMVLDYYYIYLIDNYSSPDHLNEYIEGRLSGANSLFEMDDSFLKLLGVSSLYDNRIYKKFIPKEGKLISEENRKRVDDLRLVGNPDRMNIWHWFFQHGWRVDGYVFIGGFDDVFLENLNQTECRPLIEMLSRSGSAAFIDYLYPVVGYSFTGHQTPYTDIISENTHQFLSDHSIRRYVIKNMILFRGGQETALEMVRDVSPVKYKIWLFLRI